MPVPIVVAAIAGSAASGVVTAVAFKKFVYDPCMAAAERLAEEDFPGKRRAQRRGLDSIPVPSTRGPVNEEKRGSTGPDTMIRSHAGEYSIHSIQLDPLIPLGLDEWSNDTHLLLQNIHQRWRHSHTDTRDHDDEDCNRA